MHLHEPTVNLRFWASCYKSTRFLGNFVTQNGFILNSKKMPSIPLPYINRKCFTQNVYFWKKVSPETYSSRHHCSEILKKDLMKYNARKNTCARFPFLIKLQAWYLRPATLLKKKLWHRCFPMNFAKCLKTPFLQNISSGCF